MDERVVGQQEQLLGDGVYYLPELSRLKGLSRSSREQSIAGEEMFPA
jgi:hypothetical protein